MSRPRCHLIALPHTQTTTAYNLDGFNAVTIRFAKILAMLNWEVLLYASESNEAPCYELIPCVSLAEQQQAIGNGQYQHALISPENPLWQLAGPRMIAEIGKRKRPRDFIFSIGGASQMSVTNAHPDLMTVEYCIGYEGVYANYRVYQSQAWRHLTYGMRGERIGNRFFDEVIPGFFEIEKFPENTPEDYVLYVGRIIPRKGIGIVCDAAKAAGVPLKIIGHGDHTLQQQITYGEYLGAVDEPTKIEVMSKARALLCPTVYVEPFGMISPEAQLCGTPVISSDFGGYTESVEHGYTGFRCNIFGEFVSAINKIDTLDRAKIRHRAQALYSMETAAGLYQNYFRRLNTLWEKDGGWNTRDFEVL